MDQFNEKIKETWFQVFSLSQNQALSSKSEVRVDHQQNSIHLTCPVPDFEEYSRILFEIYQLKRKKKDFQTMKKRFLEERKASCDLKS